VNQTSAAETRRRSTTSSGCRRFEVPETAHQIVNTGTAELKYLAVSTALPEFAEYPDSGKFGVLAEYVAGPDGKPQWFRFIGRERLMVDNREGE
jgi:uncharacterized cupin superfamily protein